MNKITWSFIEIIFEKELLLKVDDNYEQIVNFTKVLGPDEFVEYFEKYNVTLDSHYNDIIGQQTR